MLKLRHSEEQVHSPSNFMTVSYNYCCLAFTHHHRIYRIHPRQLRMLPLMRHITSGHKCSAQWLPKEIQSHWGTKKQVFFKIPLVLVTYSSGSNVCNLHSVWPTYQPLIENIKVQIPQFHTTAMRQAAFKILWSLWKVWIKIAIYRDSVL